MKGFFHISVGALTFLIGISFILNGYNSDAQEVETRVPKTQSETLTKPNQPRFLYLGGSNFKSSGSNRALPTTVSVAEKSEILKFITIRNENLN